VRGIFLKLQVYPEVRQAPNSVHTCRIKVKMVRRGVAPHFSYTIAGTSWLSISPLPTAICYGNSLYFLFLLQKTTLCEVEVKYGISHLAESLSYLHLAEHMFHCDVSPRNVIVCAKGTWKLSGFHFCQSIEKPVTIVSLNLFLVF